MKQLPKPNEHIIATENRYDDLDMLIPMDKIIGQCNSMTESEWQEIVEKGKNVYKDYQTQMTSPDTDFGGMGYKTATESGRSLIASLGLDFDKSILIIKK